MVQKIRLSLMSYVNIKPLNILRIGRLERVLVIFWAAAGVTICLSSGHENPPVSARYFLHVNQLVHRYQNGENI